tara:strand:+ start:899 stop:1093 length:195 start_codon:yes stop_codon:yes gene_type:complete
MKVGDLVSYGEWYNHSKNPRKARIGLIVDQLFQAFFVMWVNHEHEWECADELVIVDNARCTDVG